MKQSATNRNILSKKDLQDRRRAQDVPVEVTVDGSFGMPAIAPASAQLRKFFEEYLKDGNIGAAGVRAGYSEKYARHRLHAEVKRYADYVKWLQAHHAQQVAKILAIDQEQVLQEIVKIAMANDYDYLVFDMTQPEGKRVRKKRLDELTRDQMVAIEVFRTAKGLDYKLRDKEGRLIDLGKHLGMFNEKVILERRHVHLHQFDLRGVPIDKLEEIEQAYEREFSPQLLKKLGEPA